MLWVLLSLAVSQTEVAPEELRATALATASSTQGWKLEMSVGTSFTFNQSNNVVGTEDGTTLQLGLIFGTRAKWIEGSHEWDTTLDIQHARTQSPEIKRFLKSLDNLELKSTYLYHLQALKWFGPFARFALQTQIFNSVLVRPQDSVVLRNNLDGTQETIPVAALTEISLTHAFEPLRLRESVGAFAHPIEEKDLAIKTKLGIGAQQNIAQGGFVHNDVAGTPEIDLFEIDTTHEIGGEFEIELLGAAIEDVATWAVSANLFYPFYSSTTVLAASAT